jgi:hypothetical protein
MTRRITTPEQRLEEFYAAHIKLQKVLKKFQAAALLVAEDFGRQPAPINLQEMLRSERGLVGEIFQDGCVDHDRWRDAMKMAFKGRVANHKRPRRKPAEVITQRAHLDSAQHEGVEGMEIAARCGKK